jgi:hypothetical protein
LVVTEKVRMSVVDELLMAVIILGGDGYRRWLAEDFWCVREIELRK